MVKIELSDDDFLCLKQSLMLLIAMVGATFIDKHTEEEARICNGTIKIHQDLLYVGSWIIKDPQGKYSSCFLLLQFLAPDALTRFNFTSQM